jgi:3-hydroxymyristoyl/3-hydroxydecanoyl-(acyl carrier protein) dehydratase
VPGVVILDEVIAAIAAELGNVPAQLRLAQVKFVQPLLPEQTATIALLGAAPAWTFTVRHDERVLASGSVQLRATA